MKNIRLYILAFVLAIVTPVLILSTYAGIVDNWGSFVRFLVVGIVVAGYHVLVLAFPAFLVFQYLGLVNMWTSVIAGFVIGYIPTAWGFGWGVVGDDALLPGALGAIGGLVFWLVISRGKSEALTRPPPARLISLKNSIEIYILAPVLAVVIPSLPVSIYFGIESAGISPVIAVIPFFFFTTIYAIFLGLIQRFVIAGSVRNPTEIARIYALALVLAAVIPSLPVGIYFGIERADWSPVIPLFFLATIYASFHVLVLAFPTFLVFQHLGLVSIWTSVTAGFVIGCIPTALLFYPGDDLLEALPFGACGAIGGLVFWLVSRSASKPDDPHISGRAV